MRQCQLTTIEEDEEGLDPYIPIEVGSDRLSLHALADSGGHLNTMSWNVYQKIPGLTFHPHERIFTGSNGTISTSAGYVELPLYIKGSPCPHNFFVLPLEDLDDQVILGIPWQRKYKAYIHWAENHIYFTSECRVQLIQISSW